MSKRIQEGGSVVGGGLLAFGAGEQWLIEHQLNDPTTICAIVGCVVMVFTSLPKIIETVKYLRSEFAPDRDCEKTK